MDDDARTAPGATGWLGCAARLVEALVAAALLLVGVVVLVGVGTYVWSNWAADRQREEAERRFERLERLEVFDVPVGGADTGWSRTWPDEHEYHVLSGPGSPFTALARDRIAVPMSPVAVARTYAAVLHETGWEDVATSCARSALDGTLHAEARAWTVLEGERTVAVVGAAPEPSGTRVQVTVVVHGDQVRLHDAGPCPSTDG